MMPLIGNNAIFFCLVQILKRDIHLPELLSIKVSDLIDYPPKFIAHIKPSVKTSNPPKLQVIGLDRECYFELPTPSKLLPISYK